MADLKGLMETLTGWSPEEYKGAVLFNTTPHPINFELNGELIEVPQCGVVINATPVEKVAKSEDGIEYVNTVFEKDPESLKILEKLEELFPKVIVVGSIIAAQAYPGRVVGMTPIKGYERVVPSEKRMNPFKFTSFDVR